MMDLYFESAGMILTLITLGKTLEARAKGKTSDAITKLMNLAPKTATVERDGKELQVSVEEVQLGETLIVKAGESVPVDGIVIEGFSSVDESALTGESIPVEKHIGDKVIGATTSKSGYFKMQATKVGDDTTLAQIVRLVDEATSSKDRQDALTEKADRVLTHKFWSIPIFLVVMAAVFFLTFTIGDWLKGFLELGIESLSALISDGLIAVGVNEVLRSLLVDGIIAGVGGILTFLPNIFILFLALAFLEDSGYMARVAYVMEGIMSKLGLSGRAFIPMILGFGCTVPAIMASRSLENRRDRFKVMLITPFMSCSARLPIYILFAEMFFQERAMLVAYSMYLIGLVVAILVAAIIHLIDRRKSENYLLIELPEYKAPSARTVAIYVWEKVKDYLTKAGTTIFVASILMWVILNFGPHGYTTEMADSFGSILGHWLVPIFAPIGLGFWQIAVALIAGISAKEVVVSSCAVLFGIPNINSGAGMDTLVGILGAAGFGQLNAFCLMIFCLLYVPCAAALATIRKESGSTRWMLFSALFQLVVAWAVTFVVYRVGLLL